MEARAIDVRWMEWQVDHRVEAVLDVITEDDAFVRLVAERVAGLAASEVHASLQRSGLRSFYPKVEASMAMLEGCLESSATAASVNQQERAKKAMPTPARRGRARQMRTSEMVDQGLLAIGTALKIKDRPDSVATVVDGKRVKFRGELMTFHEWGCKATGWKSIQIYARAVLPDGRLLQALRESETDSNNTKTDNISGRSQ